MTLENDLDAVIERNQHCIDRNTALMQECITFESQSEYDCIKPRNLGALDAIQDLSCSPTLYYMHDDDISEYIVHYLQWAPNNLGALLIASAYGITVVRNNIVISDLSQNALCTIIDFDTVPDEDVFS